MSKIKRILVATFRLVLAIMIFIIGDLLITIGKKIGKSSEKKEEKIISNLI